MTKALHIVVNRTLEHGHWVAKVKKQGDEVTVVFRQREQKADFFTKISYTFRDYKNASQLSGKYLAAMNLDTPHISHNSSLNHQDRTRRKPTNEEFDKKFIDASDKLDKGQGIQHPTTRAPFTVSTSEFKSVQVTVKDAYKDQLKDQLIREKRQEFIDLFFDAVGTATGKPVSPNEKKYYGEQLKPAADICFELFDKTQWEDDDLRFAWITLKYFSKNVNFATDEKEVIKGLLTRLSDAAPHLRLGAQNEPQ